MSEKRMKYVWRIEGDKPENYEFAYGEPLVSSTTLFVLAESATEAIQKSMAIKTMGLIKSIGLVSRVDIE